jgi:hypothetical protein
MSRGVGPHQGAFDTSAQQDLIDTDSFQGPITYLKGTADALNPHVAGNYVVTTGSADGMTLTAPTALIDDGLTINVWSQTAFAHTITATSLIAAGVAAKTTITFPAFAGAGVTLRAINGLWHLVGAGGGATNGGPVVLT